jgi:hypothetical protein
MKIEFDKYSLIIDGKRKFIFSGSIHYYRLPSPILWKKRIKLFKEAGLNAIDVYFPWNYHSPSEEVYDFTGNRDVEKLLDIIEEEGLYLIARPGPYICSEIDAGGQPGWLLNKNVKLRCKEKGNFSYCKEYLKYTRKWYENIVPKIAKRKNLILFQVENEYNFVSYPKGLQGLLTEIIRKRNPQFLFELVGSVEFKTFIGKILFKISKPGLITEEAKIYFEELKNIAKENGINVPIFHNDIVSFMGRVPFVDIMAIDDYSINNFSREWRYKKNAFITIDIMEDALKKYRRNIPLFIAEFQGGWYDMWGERGYDYKRKFLGVEQIDIATKTALSCGASIINYFMFSGGTTYGYLGSPDVYTSYDFAAPISEDGRKTERFYAVKIISEFIKNYENEILVSECDKNFKIKNSRIYFKARKSNEKTFVYLRNLNKNSEKVIVYDNEISLSPVSMQIVVFDKNKKIIDKLAEPKNIKISYPEKKHILELKKWKFYFSSPQILNEFDDTEWKEIKSEKMDIDSLGIHYGFIWYRGKYKGKLKKIKIDARHIYSIYLNGKLISSFDNFHNKLGVGPDYSKEKIFEIPENLQKEENIISILVCSFGHNKDVEEDARNKRGIISVKTDKDILWKYRGGFLKGEIGITPVVDFDKIDKLKEEIIEIPHKWREDLEGVCVYETEFEIEMSELNSGIGLVIEGYSYANIYLNGYLIGRYWREAGPQKKFYLPEGILKEKNNLAIGLWKRSENSGIEKIYLEYYG